MGAASDVAKWTLSSVAGERQYPSLGLESWRANATVRLAHNRGKNRHNRGNNRHNRSNRGILAPLIRRQETGDRRQETGDRRQETGDRRQETGVRRQESGDRRQESGDRNQGTGDRGDD
jgi:hypothetical protein